MTDNKAHNQKADEMIAEARRIIAIKTNELKSLELSKQRIKEAEREIEKQKRVIDGARAIKQEIAPPERVVRTKTYGDPLVEIED